MLVLELPGNCRSPANAVLGAGHVGYRSTGGRGAEAVSLGDHVSDLVSAPTVPLNADGLLIDKSAGNDRVDGGQNTLQRALSRLADGVNNVRLQYEVSVAHIIAGNDGVGRLGFHKSMEVLGQLFIDVNQQRIFLLGIEILRLVEDAFERNTIGIAVVNQLSRSPQEL